MATVWDSPPIACSTFSPRQGCRDPIYFSRWFPASGKTAFPGFAARRFRAAPCPNPQQYWVLDVLDLEGPSFGRTRYYFMVNRLILG